VPFVIFFVLFVIPLLRDEAHDAVVVFGWLAAPVAV
jgi:hypothetical protein